MRPSARVKCSIRNARVRCCSAPRRYLRRAAAALNGSDQVVKMSYAVPGVGELKELQQGNYRVSTDAEREGAFRFAFECSGARSHQSDAGQ